MKKARERHMTREEVLTLLPEIKLIHSADLQEKSIT